ncbi:ribokinase [Tengunoibacter tsumagoiensis]|uniref:Ribokinase n=1 Tax=Tengunoibacter tsumagoiensis TaxID=2014871 RepID=A0A401ZU22_9CHLR|nr:ribokinase [Tengunoibacter tsumagoiensis]GCE10312.1 ribokinase [Tengunoibacter tsumagoiensis]
MGRVVVLGSLITDLVARAPRLPYPGESLLGNDFDTFQGGKGINQAIAARRLGAHVSLVGRVGIDTFGDEFFPILAAEEISSAFIQRDPTIGTGVSLVIIAEETGQNVIVANPRANLAVPAETVIQALETAAAEAQKEGSGTGLFLTQCETSRVSYLEGLRHARMLGMTTILNAAPIPREPLSDELFHLVDILIVNEVEAAALTQRPVTSLEAAQEAAEDLLKKGPKHVVITMGEQGALWSTYQQDSPTPLPATEHQHLPPFAVKAVDATAAGDAFCGALAAHLVQNIPLPQALQRASAAGAVTVTRKGAIASLPTVHEVDELLQPH